VGSAFLSETGDLLESTFRESDILGRVGGDEFAAAGQFSHAAMSVAVQRLRDAAVTHNEQSGRQLALSLSIGYVTADELANESLKDLMARADEAMYEEKRRKKL
jgi:diguanylate cyclase (GGDEF)-like protein